MLGEISMSTRQTVIEKVKRSADSNGSSNPQELKQLILSLSGVSDNELFFGLFSFFYDPALQSSFERQQLAGALLYELSPSCSLNLDGAIYALPAHWNLSVKEVPWYLCKAFSKGAVQEFLEELLPDVIEGSVKKSCEAMLFWVKNYSPKST